MPFLYLLIVLMGGLMGLAFSTETDNFRSLPISKKVAEAANVHNDFVFKIDCSRKGTTLTLWTDDMSTPQKAEDHIDLFCEQPEFSIYSQFNRTVWGVASKDLSKLSQLTSEQAIQLGEMLGSKAMTSTYKVGVSLREELESIRYEQAKGSAFLFMLTMNMAITALSIFLVFIVMGLMIMLLGAIENAGTLDSDTESMWAVIILALTFFVVCPGMYYSNARPSDEQLTAELRGLPEVTIGSSTYLPSAIHTVCNEGYWAQLVTYDGPTQKSVVLPTPVNCERASELAIAVVKLPSGKWEASYGSSWNGNEYSVKLNSVIEQNKDLFEPRQIRESFTKANAKLTNQFKLELSKAPLTHVTTSE